MVIVGKQRTVSWDTNSHTISWKVDDFLRRNQTLESRLFCFKPFDEQFRFTIRRTRTRDSCNNETDGVEFSILKNEPSERSLSWKLWAREGDGQFIEIAKGEWNTLSSCKHSLGPIRDVTKLLHPDGSLMLHCKLYLIPEIDDASSLSLQNSAVIREQETTPTSTASATTPRRFGKDVRVESAMKLFRMAVEVADKYEENELKLLWEKCINEWIRGNLRSVELFCPIINFAFLEDETDLIQQATKFFTENFEDILLTDQWGQFVSENPDQAIELLVKAFRMKDSSLKRIIRRRAATRQGRKGQRRRSLVQRKTRKNLTCKNRKKKRERIKINKTIFIL